MQRQLYNTTNQEIIPKKERQRYDIGNYTPLKVVKVPGEENSHLFIGTNGKFRISVGYQKNNGTKITSTDVVIANMFNRELEGIVLRTDKTKLDFKQYDKAILNFLVH